MDTRGPSQENFLMRALRLPFRHKPSKPSLADCGTFRQMFAKAPVGMALVDGPQIIETNPAWDKLFESPAQQSCGKPVVEIVPLNSLTELDTSAPVEITLTRRDGAKILLEIFAFPFLWLGRTLKVISARDITLLKAREATLGNSEAAYRKSESALRSVVSHSPLILFALDKDGVFTVAEGKGLEAIGIMPADLTGQSIFSRPSPMPALLGPVRRAMEAREVDEMIEIAGHTFEIHFRAIAGDKGSAQGVMGMGFDITDRGRAEEALRRSKEHLRTVIDSAPIVLFALDAKGNFTLCEGRGTDIMGLRPGEAVGKSAFEIYRQAPQARQNVRRALSGEEFTAISEMGSLWLETHFTPIFKGYDEVAGVIGVSINITERRRAEEALRRSEDQLRHSRKMEAIGRVAGGVAHDFNNLLTAITGYAELLLLNPDEESGESQRKNLEEIRKAAERATVLTRQLLAFSRKQVLSPKPVMLNEMVWEMDKMLRRLLREDLVLVTNLDPELGKVYADPGQMEQVILNLALNARDAMPHGGQLSLETANVELESTFARGELFLVPGSYVTLSVCDTGQGMDEDVKAHLFEPFFTTKDGGMGQGLGLPAVYGIVKQSGGTISVETEKSKGTIFKVYLPRFDKVASAPPTSRASLKGIETVLLVEDEEAVRTLVREILLMHGYQVLEAREGGEAILISQRHQGHIHLLLTDMMMANMSGKELADHLKPLRPEMQVLFISGYSEDTIVNGATDKDSFLAKPFTPKTLATKVREVLEGKPSERRHLEGAY